MEFLALSFSASPKSISDLDSEDSVSGISVSTTFYPRYDNPSDLVISTIDGVIFSVHKSVLLQKSTNAFAGLVSYQPDCLFTSVTEDSAVFNLVLHAFYELDPARYQPSLDHIEGFLNVLSKYGLPLMEPIRPGKPVYKLILAASTLRPLDAYSLASHYGLEQLAVEISSRLISVPLYNLSDDHCISMGPEYLRRLLFLHLGRTERLKTLLREPPTGHPLTFLCDAIDQKQGIIEQWHSAAAKICWDVGPDTPVSLLQMTFNGIVDNLTCTDCKILIKERIRKLVVDWTMVKTTI